jgi:hypothetical protein
VIKGGGNGDVSAGLMGACADGWVVCAWGWGRVTLCNSCEILRRFSGSKQAFRVVKWACSVVVRKDAIRCC